MSSVSVEGAAVSQAKQVWRVVAAKFVAVRAEPRHDGRCLGARKPGARVLVACRDEGWVRLHRDEGYADQPAWMLIDGTDIGAGMLLQPDVSHPLQMAMEARPEERLARGEVVVTVRKLGTGSVVEVRVPKDCKIFELRSALAEFVGRPGLMAVKLLRKNSEPTKFRPYHTEDPGYSSLQDGDDLGPIRTVFAMKGDIDPVPGSPADAALRALLPAHTFRLALTSGPDGRPLEDPGPPERRGGADRGPPPGTRAPVAAAAGAAPGADRRASGLDVD